MNHSTDEWPCFQKLFTVASDGAPHAPTAVPGAHTTRPSPGGPARRLAPHGPEGGEGAGWERCPIRAPLWGRPRSQENKQNIVDRPTLSFCSPTPCIKVGGKRLHFGNGGKNQQEKNVSMRNLFSEKRDAFESPLIHFGPSEPAGYLQRSYFENH